MQLQDIDIEELVEKYETYEREAYCTGVPLNDLHRRYYAELRRQQSQLLTQDDVNKLTDKIQKAHNILKEKISTLKLAASDLKVKNDAKILLSKYELKILEIGKLAQQTLINNYYLMVFYISIRYWGRGLSKLDLIEQGNLGLKIGIENFDYNKGLELSNYIIFYVRKEISNSIIKQRKNIFFINELIEYGVIKNRSESLKWLERLLHISKYEIKKITNIYISSESVNHSLDDVEKEIEIFSNNITKICPVCGNIIVAEKQDGHKLSGMFSDKSCEYSLHEFKNYCRDNYIFCEKCGFVSVN